MVMAEKNPEFRTPNSAMFRAWCVIVAHSFGRHWRVRQMGWVALGLLAFVVVAVAVVSNRPGGWGLDARMPPRNTNVWTKPPWTYRTCSEALLPQNRYGTDIVGAFRAYPRLESEREGSIELFPRPWDPLANGVQSLILSIPHAIMQSEKFLEDWKFLSFSRWVVLGSYLGFVLPLFTLAYASAAIGAEREARSLIWLLTRPVPRSAVYLGTFMGTLPWCLLFGVGGFVALCLAGGELGQKALAVYWPAAVAGTIAFAALFHLLGALVRRPIVVGLIYVFFYEALVASLPGSLKKFSLNFYTRSLMNGEASAAGYPGAMLDVSAPVSSGTAWAVLLLVTVLLTTLGMVLFARSEQRDDV